MISANKLRVMNPDPTKAMNTEDTDTDGLKFDLPPGQTPDQGLGNGDTGLRDFNPADPDSTETTADEKAAWNAATGDGEANEETSIADQDNSTV